MTVVKCKAPLNWLNTLRHHCRNCHIIIIIVLGDQNKAVRELFRELFRDLFLHVINNSDLTVVRINPVIDPRISHGIDIPTAVFF